MLQASIYECVLIGLLSIVHKLLFKVTLFFHGLEDTIQANNANKIAAISFSSFSLGTYYVFFFFCENNYKL